MVMKAPGYYMCDFGGISTTTAPGNPQAWRTAPKQVPDWEDRGHWENEYSYYDRWRGRRVYVDPVYVEHWVKVTKTVQAPFDRGGPSYGQFAKRMAEQFAARSKLTATEEAWSQAKAEKMRRVLFNEPLYRQTLSQKGHGTTGQVLPALAATLFLAEPARNPRAFPVNLMLLTMMEMGTTFGGRKKGSSPKHYTWDNSLWAYSKNRKGKVSKGDMHVIGGKVPAAMTGSGSHAVATDIDPGKHLTQAKELTTICHWLGQMEPFVGTNAYLTGGHTEIPYQAVAILGDTESAPEDGKDPVEWLRWIKTLFHSRCSHFSTI
jgi:hypothetical protein